MQDLQAEGHVSSFVLGLRSLNGWDYVLSLPQSLRPGLALSRPQDALAQEYAAERKASYSVHKASWTPGSGTPLAILPQLGSAAPDPMGFCGTFVL